MTESLKEFMNSIIDYAGLFPPAKLPLDTAIHNYATYRNDAGSWMLSRFIIPAVLLPDVAEYAEELFTPEEPFAFSVLGKATKTIQEFEHEIEHVLKRCTEFNQSYSDSVTTDMMEIKLPKEAVLSHDVGLLQQLMDNTSKKLGEIAHTPQKIFYEGFMKESWKKDTEAVIQAISSHNEKLPAQNEYYQSAAFKIRCGGVKAELFPSVKQVAFILNQANKHNVSVKATAGLHHPVRHYADEVQTNMHGFFNVFGGAMLAHANDLDDSTFEEILREEDADQFKFTDETFSWKNYAVLTRQIKALRERALLSYGSCSFDEPREDLQKLKLL